MIGDMKPHPEMIEGPEAWDRFQKAMKRVVAVPHAEIQKRIEAHRQEAARNPNRRGPKKRKLG
jgi:hypothetical protein